MAMLKRYWVWIAVGAILLYLFVKSAVPGFSPPNSTALIGHPGTTNPGG